jgi:menaquinone-9 beta-reductase
LTELPRQVDVLVAGAGPAGSSSAALFARAGLSVLAVDRAAFPRDKPCAEYMSPEAVRILSRLGVVEQLERSGAVALEGMTVTGAQGATAHGVFARARHPPFRATGLSVSRRILDDILVDAARTSGAVVAEQTSVEELLYDQGAITGVVVRDRAGQRRSIRARLTVGADGLRSVVARRLGRRSHRRPRRVAFVAHMAGVRSMGASAELHFGHHGYVGLNRIGQNEVNVALVVPQELAAGSRGRVRDFFLQTLGEFAGVGERVLAGEIVRSVLVTGPFAAWSRRVAAPGSLLVGDAADFYDPVTGDGILSALRGAELVAETMIPALCQPGGVRRDVFRQYQRRRRQVFAGKWIMERVTRYMMSSPWFFNRSVSRLGRHEDMAHAAIGVAGGFVPLRDILNPRFLARMVL